MKKKVILISIDGMRPDGFLQCGNPFVQELMNRSTYALEGAAVMPSVTLPCHMSMFHSVTPQRHGILTNTYVPMVRPINSLFEQVNNAGGACAMYYGWEPLRDVSRPGCLKHAEYFWMYNAENTDRLLTESALAYIEKQKPDFVFLYLGETDDKGGHRKGWMSPEYLQYVYDAIDCVKMVLEAVGDEYTVVITADHGGHERSHGSEMPEDMLIPMLFVGTEFAPGKKLSGIGLLDIAPTIADLMGVPMSRDWEGASILAKAGD